ncbi:MAG: hypothetical protein AAB035_00390 [Nitrospirota bacterium]
MKVDVVYAIQTRPDDEDPLLHEFGLLYFEFAELETDRAKPAVWVRFSDVNQIETLQFHCPDAKLGPSAAFTEALILTDSLDAANALCKKIEHFLTDAQMKEIFGEDTLEDY